MRAITHFFKSVSTSSLAEADEKRKPPSHTKAVDCVFIVGPGMQGMVDDYEMLARRQGLKSIMIGDGTADVTREMINAARRSNLIGPNTQIICQLHGSVRDNQGVTTHQLRLRSCEERIGESNYRSVPTREFIQWLREPLNSDNLHDNPVDPWYGNIHLLSCKIGEIRKDVRSNYQSTYTSPENAGSSSEDNENRGAVILYGGNKILLEKTARSNLYSLLGYIGECKRNHFIAPDLSAMFDRIKSQSLDTVIVLDGNLKQLNLSKAPKSLLELLPEHQLAAYRQQIFNAPFDRLVNDKDVFVKNSSAVKNSLWEKLSITEKNRVSKYIQIRISHLKTREKLDQFKQDLSIDPKLANIRVGSLTPLMLIADRHYTYQGQTVKHSDIARTLIDAGADLNARDLSGKTATHHAAKKNSIGVLNAIYEDRYSDQSDVKLSDVDARDYSGATAAYYAAKAGNHHALELLLNKKAKMVGVDALRGATLLHMACKAEHNRFATVQSILNKGARSLINKRDLSGKTALHIAVMAGDVQTVKALLQDGANPSQRTFGFNTAADLAKALKGEQRESMLALLQAAKAEKMPRASGASFMRISDQPK